MGVIKRGTRNLDYNSCRGKAYWRKIQLESL